MVSCLHKDIGISRTLTARVIAVCILTGLNEMDLLTTAEERMSLEENDFQYLQYLPVIQALFQSQSAILIGE